MASRHPVHVTMRLVDGLPSLRKQAAFDVVRTAFRGARGREGFRLVHYSVLSNHLHLVVEAKDASALSLGLRSIQARMAYGLNRLWERKGRLFGDRYHARALKTPREVRNALAYVLLNARKHAAEAGRRLLRRWLDPFSSGGCFDGWRSDVRAHRPPDAFDVTSPRTWLLHTGWRRHRLLLLDEVPG